MFDPYYPEKDVEDFNKHDWSDLYGNDLNPVPSNTPMPLGGEFMMRAYVGASFAVCKVTSKSRTGFMVLFNSVPTFWFSKNKGFCEINTFGSEFVAMN